MQAKKNIIYALFVLLLTPVGRLMGEEPAIPDDPPFMGLTADFWVKEKMERMTAGEKIAQLMMVPVFPRQGEAVLKEKTEQIRRLKPGGILVMQGSPVKTVRWINRLQEHSEVPLLVAVDAEWGLPMRIDSTMRYPYAQALGAVRDTSCIYQMGKDVAEQMKQMGMHMNFAPVADVNTNPDNPVINFRSFGEDKINVSLKAWYFASGLQDAGVVAVAKHFPGHGDTRTDSHKELPVLRHSKERIDRLESFPFRYLIERGITGIMSAHLDVPSLDPSGTPSSLSGSIINDYLRKEVGFQGLVVTDALNMKGVQTGEENIALKALKAGNDLVEFVPDLEKAVASVKEAVARGEISMEEIEEKCRRILALKRWSGLHNYEPAVTKELSARLNAPSYEVTVRKLVKGSMTVLKKGDLLPLGEPGNKKIASVMIGAETVSPFQKMLEKYSAIDHYWLGKNASEKDLARLRCKLENYDLVITGIQGIHIYPSGMYGTTPIQQNAAADIIRENRTIAVFFGNAYALKHFENIQHAAGLILAYQDNVLPQELAAQLVFGAFDATGRLPVTIDERFRCNDGIPLKRNGSLGYSIPAETGPDAAILNQKIDSLALLGIEKEAYPGCQVLIVHKGNVILHKCYGFYTYEMEKKVEPDNIYDWASLTKVTGPLLPLMKLFDEGKIKLDVSLSTYWPDFKGTDKEKLTVREVLAHQAGLEAWISFWQMAVDEKGRLSREVFKQHPTPDFDVRVSDHLYMNPEFREAIFDTIRTSELSSRKKYKYSGLSFYLFPAIITKLTGQPYEQYLRSMFFSPLGAGTVTYNAYRHFPRSRIVPTEIDDFFRQEKLWGFVHDEGAAMMGGVSGNAGLFGTANDLAKLFQMLLQKGYYGGKRFISEATVNEFTRIQYPGNKNRRGLGFDKPYIDNHKRSLDEAYPAPGASKNSFGHSGYTGTFAWADPDHDLVFIFLSNRVYPTRNNGKLYDLNIRPAMHQAIYECLDEPSE